MKPWMFKLSLIKSLRQAQVPHPYLLELLEIISKAKKVVKLEYEAYEPMAKKKLKELCNRLRVKWADLKNIAIFHRLGAVGPREASVIIAVSSAHRKDSLEAVQFAIDELKATVPIWKKELYEDGSEWKENKECFWTSKQEMEIAANVDPSLVQITASNDEINGRINQFIATKRADIDNANIMEFCGEVTDDPNAGTCARTNAVLTKKRDSKSHLRKSVVANQVGPSMTSVLDDRLSNLETAAGVNPPSDPLPPIPKDVYERLKALEDRLLLLERFSPDPGAAKIDNTNERFDESATNSCVANRKEEISKSLTQINDEMQKLKNELMMSK